MIIKNEQIMEELENLIEMSKIIEDDFECNGKVHCVYMKEKLSRAKDSLEWLLEIANEKIKEKNRKYVEGDE